MDKVPKVLVVDDDRLVRNVVSRFLGVQFEVETAVDGEEGLEKAHNFKPDFILLDVEMPGINGFEVCDRLKQDPASKEIPVLIISGRTQLRERMQGYEAGAADFITKPFEPEVLLAKLNVLTQYKRDRNLLSAKVDMASKTAFAAMRGSSELGLAIQFIEATYGAKSFDGIAKKFFNVTAQLSLNCCLMFLTKQGKLYFSSQGSTSPLEKEVITTIYESGKRFCDFGSRTQINYPRVALLVKNMPLDDQLAYGRYKDFLPTMLGSTDANIKALDTENALLEQTRNLAQSFDLVKTTLQEVGANLQMTQQEVLQLLRNTTNEMERKIPTLGLEDDQERYLINTLDAAIHDSHHIIESGESAAAAFSHVCRLLDHLAHKQQQMTTEITTVNENPKLAGGASFESDLTSDIELF